MTSTQTPIHASFGAASTAEEVLGNTDLSGKTVIVTGGHSGIGLETVRVLARAGARVIVPARSLQRARDNLDRLGLGGVDAREMDLAAPDSVEAFAAAFLAGGAPLHLLIHSAGIMATPFTRDVRGFEAQFSTNHLGHFQLASRLWPALQRAQGARIVSVSSRGHRIAPVDFDDIHFERRAYDKWVAYGQSKSANALFAVAADRRGAADGIRAYSLHPGTILSPLARHLSAEEIASFGVHDRHGALINDPERDLKNVRQGAATGVWCATSPALNGLGGVYCEDCDVAPMAGGDGRRGVHAWAVDPALAERLWQVSAAMAG